MDTRIRSFETLWHDGQFSADGLSMSALFDHVYQKGTAVLRNVFPAQQLISLREQVYEWGKEQPLQPPQSMLETNFHTIETGISPRQQTMHHYHAYNFNQLHQLPSPLQEKLTAVYDPIRLFINALTSQDAHYHLNDQGQRLHPQIIQYPCGGGGFGKHIHALEPQRIGSILGLSRRGTDFDHGAVHFSIDQQDINSESVHDLGDLLLFRYDIPHWVDWIDVEKTREDEKNHGRWTLIMPFY